MIKERIDKCTACPGTLEKEGSFWVCQYCGAKYSIGKQYDGSEFTYPVAERKELPCGKMEERASEISVNKITVKEIRPPEEIEATVYGQTALDYREAVGVITNYLKQEIWDAAKDEVYKLKKSGNPSSEAAGCWYEIACDRQAHNDKEVMQSFTDISKREISVLDNIFQYAVPDFRNTILDLVWSDGFVGDEQTKMLFDVALPYTFNESIYSPSACREKIDAAFEGVTQRGYSQTFKYLLTHTLASNEVDRYISYLEQYAEKRTPSEAQEYYDMILAVDPGNIKAHKALVKADLKSDSKAKKCIADFEKLILYSKNPLAEVEEFISILTNEKTTTKEKSDFMWSLLSYHHEDETKQKNAMAKYAKILLESELWAKASDYYSAVLSKNTQDPEVYFYLCLADMKFRNDADLIASDETFVDHPYYKKALGVAEATQNSQYSEYLSNLIELRKKRVEDAIKRKKRKRKLIISGIISVVVIAAFLIGFIVAYKSCQRMSYSADNIILSIEDRVEPTKDSYYYDGYVTAFEVKIKNKSILEIIEIKGDLALYNSVGEHLLTTTCTFSDLYLAKGTEISLVLNIDERESDEILELYYTDYEALNATFKLTEVIYFGYIGKEYSEEPVTILQSSVEGGGMSAVEESYQEAIELFEDEEYADALEIFESLGNYKDSADYYEQCLEYIESIATDLLYNNALSLFEQEKYGDAIAILYEISDYKDSAEKIGEIIAAAEAKAKSYAEEGKYNDACTVLAGIGYTESNSNTYKAYYCASEGFLADAVKYGLTVLYVSEQYDTIPDNYFRGASKLEKVILPSTIKTIGKEAFSGCTSLSSINLPDGITSIGDKAFYNCSSLESISIGNDVESIGNETFYGCSSLSSLTIGNQVASIGNYAFYDCESLTSIIVPDSVKSIGKYAFKDCSSISELDLGDGLETIGDEAFYDCCALTSVVVPNSVTSIGSSAFGACTSLEDITIPFVGGSATASSAGSSTLFGYIFGTRMVKGATSTNQRYSSYSSQNYYIPDTLRSVTVTGGKLLYGAFYNCSGLTSIKIEKGSASIPDFAFYNCYNIADISLPNNIASIGVSSFEDCQRVSSFVLGDNLTAIGDSAFSGCSGIRSITIPENVLGIGSNAFKNCYRLVEVINKSSNEIIAGDESFGRVAYYALEVHDGESKIESKNDYLFFNGSADKYLIGYTGADTELTLPNAYKGSDYGIAFYAFYNNSSLTSVQLSNGVTSIGGAAFCGCSSLTEINIPDSVSYIGEKAFSKCESLSSAIIGDGVASISDSAFANCSSLVSVTLGSSVASIGNGAFSACDNLVSITIPSSVTSIGAKAFYGCGSLVAVVFENKEGWRAASSPSSSGSSIKSSSLSNAATAASYLTDTYYYANYYWTRT